MITDRFRVNKIISLYSIKYMFDNDLKVVQEYLFSNFPNIYNDIVISHEIKNKYLIRMNLENNQKLY